MNDPDYPFHYGTMTKTELAWLYFPGRDAIAARRGLNYWVRKNKDLLDELVKTGYASRNRLLTPVQISLIIRYLGDP